MRYSNPFGANGSVEARCFYYAVPKVGPHELKIDSSGNGEGFISVKPDVELITLNFIVTYDLRVTTKFGDTFMMDTKAEISFEAEWRAVFGENGLDLAPHGVQPKRIKETRNGPIVVAAYTKIASSKINDKTPFVELAVQLVAGDEKQLPFGLQDGSPPTGTSIAHHQVKAPLHFMLRTYVEVIKAKVKPDTVVVGSFAFGESSMNKVKAISKMLDRNKLKAWYKGLPDRTRNKIEKLQKPPGDEFIVMKGFTDNVGEEHKNTELGRKRAVAVAEEFEAICGVPWKKLITAPGKGEQDDPQENKNLEKKEAKHRRVEIEIHIEK